MRNDLLETWDIHHRINIYLLESVNEAHYSDLSASGGRTVGEQFAHIHNVRLMWLKAARPDLLEGQRKFEKQEALTRIALTTSLGNSSIAIRKLLETAFDEGRVKGFKPHPAAFLGYLISHESHHRGQIMLSLKQSGHPVDKKTQFGVWEWGTR